MTALTPEVRARRQELADIISTSAALLAFDPPSDALFTQIKAEICDCIVESGKFGAVTHVELRKHPDPLIDDVYAAVLKVEGEPLLTMKLTINPVPKS